MDTTVTTTISTLNNTNNVDFYHSNPTLETEMGALDGYKNKQIEGIVAVAET